MLKKKETETVIGEKIGGLKEDIIAELKNEVENAKARNQKLRQEHISNLEAKAVTIDSLQQPIRTS